MIYFHKKRGRDVKEATLNPNPGLDRVGLGQSLDCYFLHHFRNVLFMFWIDDHFESKKRDVFRNVILEAIKDVLKATWEMHETIVQSLGATILNSQSIDYFSYLLLFFLKKKKETKRHSYPFLFSCNYGFFFVDSKEPCFCYVICVNSYTYLGNPTKYFEQSSELLYILDIIFIFRNKKNKRTRKILLYIYLYFLEKLEILALISSKTIFIMRDKNH